MIACQTSVSLSTLLICIIDGSPSPDKFNEFGDSSGSLFSIYSKTKEEYDNKRAERHQKDAEGIVIFVSPYFCFRALSILTKNTVDWFILRRSCCIDYGVDPRHQARPTGQVRLLS